MKTWPAIRHSAFEKLVWGWLDELETRMDSWTKNKTSLKEIEPLSVMGIPSVPLGEGN